MLSKDNGTFTKNVAIKVTQLKLRPIFFVVCKVFHFPQQKWFQLCLEEHNNLKIVLNA
jgi:hypothetical protein